LHWLLLIAACRHVVAHIHTIHIHVLRILPNHILHLLLNSGKKVFISNVHSIKPLFILYIYTILIIKPLFPFFYNIWYTNLNILFFGISMFNV
jgi:hypothetical protein